MKKFLILGLILSVILIPLSAFAQSYGSINEQIGIDTDGIFYIESIESFPVDDSAKRITVDLIFKMKLKLNFQKMKKKLLLSLESF